VAASASVSGDLPKCEDYYQMGDNERTLGIKHYPISRSDYSNIFARLNEFVMHEETPPKRTNTFFVSKVETDENCTLVNDDACRYVYAFWKEENSILIINSPFDEEDSTYYGWSYLKRINLSKDVVPTWKEVGWSTYLIPEAEAKRLLHECKSNGIKIMIERPLS
jgi:hypothetical protein